MILSVEERVLILSILPNEGNFATLKVLTQLRMGLSFTEKELKEWEIEEEPAANRIKWQTNGETEIPIGEKATDIIVGALKRLDKGNKLPLQAVGIYEKFITTE